MSGVGIDHVRCHVISQAGNKGHVIRHVTCLGVSEDYTSRRDLESSEIQHMISKTFRDERQIATSRLSQKESFREEAACIQGSDNNLYCTNRTSLENLFYATRDSIYTRGWKLLEGRRKLWKVTEAKRRSWNLMEVSRKRKNHP